MLSPNSAVKAEQLGYTNVKIYHDGLPVWKKGKNLVISSAQGLKAFKEKEIPFVAIDVRGPSEIGGGVIPGAVNVPLANLPSMKSAMPKQKSAPVILYSDKAPEAEAAFAMVRGWGYKNATVLQGGLAAWTEAGGELVAEPLAAIAYTPKARPGSIAPEEFNAVAAGKNPGAVILDVRGSDETSEGMIKGAINIPVTELEDRIGELPKDKLIVCQCNTGVQAEMAYTILADAGLKAKFLNATISIDDEGDYEIDNPAEE